MNLPVEEDRRSGIDRRLVARGNNSNIFGNELTTNKLPKNKEERALLPQQNIHTNDNFFLKPSANQANLLQYKLEPKSQHRIFIFSSHPELVSGSYQ